MKWNSRIPIYNLVSQNVLKFWLGYFFILILALVLVLTLGFWGFVFFIHNLHIFMQIPDLF